MATPEGVLFNREAILENLLAQKKANKRKLAAWEAQQESLSREVRSNLTDSTSSRVDTVVGYSAGSSGDSLILFGELVASSICSQASAVMCRLAFDGKALQLCRERSGRRWTHRPPWQPSTGRTMQAPAMPWCVC